MLELVMFNVNFFGLLLLCVFFILPHQAAYSLSCARWGLAPTFKTSDAVFVGTVKDTKDFINNDNLSYESFTYTVVKGYKNASAGQTFDVSFLTAWGDQPPSNQSAELLVFISESNDGSERNVETICSESKEYGQEAADFFGFKSLEDLEFELSSLQKLDEGVYDELIIENQETDKIKNEKTIDNRYEIVIVLMAGLLIGFIVANISNYVARSKIKRGS